MDQRYHLLYHTLYQVITGYTIGLLAGTVYFVITVYIPLYYPQSILGKLRRTLEWIWEGLGGIGGWDLGAAQGGWGEGWIFVTPHKTGDSSRER